jgi:hypothetical protein
MRTPTSRQGNNLTTKVYELIDPVTGSWDNHLVNQTFSGSESSAILAIPIFEDIEDFLAWHPNNRGIFSSKISIQATCQSAATAWLFCWWFLE